MMIFPLLAAVVLGTSSPSITEHPPPSFVHSVEADYPWQPSDLSTESRSPCPMLNALANHGMLPRDGKNISAFDIADSFKRHLNMEWEFAYLVSHTAVDTVKPGSSTIDLSDINVHNGIQHDAALTRNDFGYGEYYTQKNQTLVDQLIALNTSGYLSYNEIAIARLLREQQCRAWNPNFTLPGRLNLIDLAKNKWFVSIDQAVTGLVVLSDPLPGKDWPSCNIQAERLRFFLEYERLPFSIGWKQSPFELTKTMVIEGVAKTAASYVWNSFKTIASPIGLAAGPDPNPSQIM